MNGFRLCEPENPTREPKYPKTKAKIFSKKSNLNIKLAVISKLIVLVSVDRLVQRPSAPAMLHHQWLGKKVYFYARNVKDMHEIYGKMSAIMIA